MLVFHPVKNNTSLLKAEGLAGKHMQSRIAKHAVASAIG